MKYIKLFENYKVSYQPEDRKIYYSINFQDPYMIYKASKILKNVPRSEKKINALIQFKENNKDETRLLYITPFDLPVGWNSFDTKYFTEHGFVYMGDVELTPEEKELADMEINAKKYNL